MLSRADELRKEADELYQQAKASDDTQQQLSLYPAAITKLNELGDALTDTDRLLIARCQNNIGLAYEKLNHRRACIDNYAKAIQYWYNIQNPTEEHYPYVVHMYHSLCKRYFAYVLNQSNSDFKSEAVQFAKKSMDELKQLLIKPGREQPDNELRLFGKLHYLLARCGTDIQRDALATYKKAIEFFDKIKIKQDAQLEDYDLLGQCKHCSGNIHLARCSTDQAIPFFESAINFFSQVKNSKEAVSSIAVLTDQLADIRTSERNDRVGPMAKVQYTG